MRPDKLSVWLVRVLFARLNPNATMQPEAIGALSEERSNKLIQKLEEDEGDCSEEIMVGELE